MLRFNRPFALLSEREPRQTPTGRVEVAEVATVFLTATRCPIGCSMCDLHHHTLPDPSPAGAIPTQIRFAMDNLPPADWIKLYNSGNFFDPRSIPPEDHSEIADRCAAFDRVVIENHPRFGTRRLANFTDQLSAQLEIAVGLESVQPRLLDRLGKQMTRDDFDRYARRLRQLKVDLRVFLIVGAPGLTIAESFRWARLSVRHAVAVGARHISLIPARSGEGWGGTGNRLPPIELEHMVELFLLTLRDVDSAACLSVDTWDLRREHDSESDRTRLDRLEAAILSQSSGDL